MLGDTFDGIIGTAPRGWTDLFIDVAITAGVEDAARELAALGVTLDGGRGRLHVSVGNAQYAGAVLRRLDGGYVRGELELRDLFGTDQLALGAFLKDDQLAGGVLRAMPNRRALPIGGGRFAPRNAGELPAVAA